MRLLACLLVLGAVPAQARKPSEYLGTYHLTGHLAGSACSFADLETPRVVFPYRDGRPARCGARGAGFARPRVPSSATQTGLLRPLGRRVVPPRSRSIVALSS